MRAILPALYLLVSASATVIAQQPVTRLRIDAVQPAIDGRMRVQAAGCSGDTCLFVFGGMRDSSDLVAWPTIYWTRSVGAVDDSTVRRLPDQARPSGAMAVAPDESGFLLAWSDERDGRPGVLALALDRYGAPIGQPWPVLDGRWTVLRLLDAAGDHLLVATDTGGAATVLRMRGRESSHLDTLPIGARVWRAHGWGDHIAITTGDSTELRTIDSYDPVGRTTSARFAGTSRFESDGGLWTMIDSTLAYYARFDDAAPTNMISSGAIPTPFRGAVWIMKKEDGTIGIAYASVDAALRVTLHRRWLDSSGVLSPPSEEWIGTTYDGLDVMTSSLALSLVEREGMRVPALRYAYDYLATRTGNTFSGTAFAGIVVEPDGRGTVLQGEGAWIPIDADGDGLPIRLHRRIAEGIDDVVVHVISNHDVRLMQVPPALARIETDQSVPAVITAGNGYVVAWIESPPKVPRSVKIARWNGVDETVSIAGSLDALRVERGSEYRLEHVVGHWRYPGASIAFLVSSEMNHPSRPSYPAWDKASWAVRRATPDATWLVRQLGDLYAPWMVSSSQPAGGTYFQTTGFDPVRDEVVILAARGTAELALTGVAPSAERTWTRPLPVMRPTALVPIDSSDVVLVFGDTLRRVDPTVITTLARRLERPVREYEPVWRELGRSFIHLRLDTGTAALVRYDLDGRMRERASIDVPRTARWSSFAHRRSDTATALIWADGNLLRLTLLDRQLGVRVADSIIVRSDGEVRDPYAVFVGDDLLVAWEDRGPRGSDIAIVRISLDAVPASIESPKRDALSGHAIVRVVDNVIRDGSLSLDVSGASTPIRMALVDASGRTVFVRRIEPRQGRIDLTVKDLPTGIYFLRAETGGDVVFARVTVAGR